MLTLADISTPRFQSVTGYCPGSADFLEMVNDAVDELIRRGDWSETLMPMRICQQNGCVTFPRWVGQIRKMYTCRSTVNMRSQWFDFLQTDGREESWRGMCGDERNMVDQYRAPVYNDVYGTNCYVRYYPLLTTDSGATCTLFGVDSNGQPLQTDNGNGTFSPGVIITAAQPYGSTSTTIGRIDRVARSATQGNCLLYAYDATMDVLLDLAVYSPSETNPSYLRYKLSGGTNQWNPNCPQSIVALVKLQQLPIQVSTDLVIINNRGALLNALKAMKCEDAGDSAGAATWWKIAIEKLQRQQEDSEPEYQFAAQNNTFGQTSIGRSRAF